MKKENVTAKIKGKNGYIIDAKLPNSLTISINQTEHKVSINGQEIDMNSTKGQEAAKEAKAAMQGALAKVKGVLEEIF